jgi:hypothetical protein
VLRLFLRAGGKTTIPKAKNIAVNNDPNTIFPFVVSFIITPNSHSQPRLRLTAGGGYDAGISP